MTTWFWLIFLMSQDKGGISTMRASKLLGMHYTTVYKMMTKVRIAMQNRQENILLAGLVEIDDAFFGGKSRGKLDGRSQTRSKSA
ncbi:IS1595 family transposase [bacterium]|nr:IS1595 family transposase [bacterium]QQR56236.1 MAG: IS1595 family transposase [Candidatus Melainabacteria bacterium]